MGKEAAMVVSVVFSGGFLAAEAGLGAGDNEVFVNLFLVDLLLGANSGAIASSIFLLKSSVSVNFRGISVCRCVGEVGVVFDGGGGFLATAGMRMGSPLGLCLLVSFLCFLFRVMYPRALNFAGAMAWAS